MKNLYSMKHYYFVFEAIWVLSCIIIPTYMLLAIFSLNDIIIQVNAILIELLLWGVLFIGLRDYSTSHLFIYFDANSMNIKEGYITGRFLGYDSYPLENIDITSIAVFNYFEFIKIEFPNRIIRINSLMFSQKDFQDIKNKLKVVKE